MRYTAVLTEIHVTLVLGNVKKEDLSHNMTKPTNWMCAQRRLRSAWASAQSDQSSLCVQWVAKDPRCLHSDSEDTDKTERMSRLIWVFAGRTLILLVRNPLKLLIMKHQTVIVAENAAVPVSLTYEYVLVVSINTQMGRFAAGKWAGSGDADQSSFESKAWQHYQLEYLGLQVLLVILLVER